VNNNLTSTLCFRTDLTDRPHIQTAIHLNQPRRQLILKQFRENYDAGDGSQAQIVQRFGAFLGFERAMFTLKNCQGRGFQVCSPAKLPGP
jgi:hypothetical protein